ncbi:response regulator [Candidatus Dojkabacteria bacterium]|nr:response regulator [Candidatus Dojkabacteria bacterium]
MKRIVLIDDDYAIREGIKTLIASWDRKVEEDYEIYTSENGVEGLGYVYLVKPDVVIIDVTLPKYSGRELIEYLKTNHRLLEAKVKVLVLVENGGGDEIKDLPENFKIISKKAAVFEEKIKSEIGIVSVELGFIERLANYLVRIGNQNDILLRKISTSGIFFKIPAYVLWFFYQVALSLILFTLRLAQGKRKDGNVKQEKKDLAKFRVRYYPTLITLLTTLIFIALQTLLFVAGGFVIMDTRVESIFAMGFGEEGYEFTAQKMTDYEYDPEKVEFTANGVQLVAIENVINVISDTTESLSEETLSPETEEQDQIQTDDAATEETSVETPVEENEETTEDEQTAPKNTDVLGAERSAEEEGTAEETTQETIITYPTDNPSIKTKNGIEYSDLLEIVERSNINDDNTSSRLPESSENDLGMGIKYQLSPDGINWYYYSNIEARWAKTVQDYASSNTIQEVNANLDIYQENFGSGKLYLQVYLHIGSSKVTPILNEVIIGRETGLITMDGDNILKEPGLEEVVIGALDWEKVEPEIFNASYVNGNKIIKGKVLLKDKAKKAVYEVKEERLNDYRAVTTYNNDEVIGETNLYVNERGEIEFLLRTPSASGGYVKSYIINKENEEDRSSNSKAVENSTFTIDSTADTADASAGDGLCADAGGDCTLRAAIQEANALAGADNIYFNIPTSDTGYRDYDDPNTPSSGDSVGGDDYWTIRPTSTLAGLSGITVIDGATQTTNQGNFNTAGPEVEINGISAGAVDGLTFNAGSGTSTVNSLVINNFDDSSKSGIKISTDGIEVTNSYVGTDITSEAKSQNYYGIYIGAVGTVGSPVQIGNTTSDGNVISGNYNTGIRAVCGSSGTGRYINIAGNKIGVSYSGLVSVANADAVLSQGDAAIDLSGDCVTTIGGNTASNRNIISGSRIGIDMNLATSAIPDVQIYNNFFGTDVTGETSLGDAYYYHIYIRGYRYDGAQNPIQIGDNGKGNLFRYGGTQIGMRDPGDVNVVANTLSGGYNALIIYGDFDWASDYKDINQNYYNNFLSNESVTDPYFGVSLDSTATAGYAFYMDSTTHTNIKGNSIKGYLYAGIYYYDTIATWRRDAWPISPVAPSLIIGGTNSQTGSLCNGLEQNCIENNGMRGIVLRENISENEATMAQDNYFGSGNGTGGEYNFEQSWKGVIELFSNDHRRTDILDETYIFEIPEEYDFYNNLVELTELSNYSQNCLSGATHCPATGHSIGTSGKTSILNRSSSNPFTNFSGSMSVAEFRIDSNGDRVEIASEANPIHFDEPHLASLDYSFDGKSISDPIQTGTVRVVDGENFYDRGEPWTDKLAADRSIATNNFGRFQTMEAEVVDANPMIQDDGTYSIVVDSATSEDNVSVAGYDDGGGAYSGGGSEGFDGLADLATSLNEAVKVSSAFAGNGVRITAIETYGTTLALSNPLVVVGDTNATRDIIDGNGGTIDGTGLAAGQACIDATTLNNVTITNLTFENCPIAVELNSGAAVTITGNVFDESYIDLLGTANDSIATPVITNVQYLSGGVYRIYGITTSDNVNTAEVCLSNIGAGDCLESLGTYSISGKSWYVDVTFSGDNGTQSRTFSILTTNTNGSTSEFSNAYSDYTLAEYPITLVYPIDGEEVTDRSPILDWNDNGDLDLDHYDVYLNHDDSSESNLVKIGTIDDTDVNTDRIRTNFRISGELPLEYTDYYWKVVGIRENGTTGGESNVEDFEVVESIEALTLIYPTDGIGIDERQPILQWSRTDIDDAKYYKIYLQKLPGDENEDNPELGTEYNLLATIEDTSVEEYQLTEEQALELGDYEWKVEAYYVDDKMAAESDTGQFSVIEGSIDPDTGDIVNVSADSEEVESRVISAAMVIFLFILGGVGFVGLMGYIAKNGKFWILLGKKEKDEEKDKAKPKVD